MLRRDAGRARRVRRGPGIALVLLLETADEVGDALTWTLVGERPARGAGQRSTITMLRWRVDQRRAGAYIGVLGGWLDARTRVRHW